MTVAPASLSVAHRRVEPSDSLDFFPTGPWAVRALIEHVIGQHFRSLGTLRHQIVEEPACGQGHMAYGLSDAFGAVRSSDIFDHGWLGDGAMEIRDFLDADAWEGIERPDWIVTNPPFGDQALAFMLRAIARRPRIGIAFFLRTTALDGLNRHDLVYRPTPPAIVAQFAERVPVHKGRWVPDGSTFTPYLWMVWRFDRPVTRTDTIWIPRCRERLTFQRDIDRFGVFDEESSAPSSSFAPLADGGPE